MRIKTCCLHQVAKLAYRLGSNGIPTPLYLWAMLSSQQAHVLVI